jgi:hypothetical protein
MGSDFVWVVAVVALLVAIGVPMVVVAPGGRGVGRAAAARGRDFSFAALVHAYLDLYEQPATEASRSDRHDLGDWSGE